MAQILVRHLDDRVVSRLKKRASNAGRSLQAEVKSILERESRFDPGEAWALAERIRLSFGKRRFPDSAKTIRALRDAG